MGRAYRFLVGKHGGTIYLEDRYRGEDNIKTHLKEIVHRTGFMWLRIGRSGELL
jgi:hypothetical protein